jgi:hypothetical protein
MIANVSHIYLTNNNCLAYLLSVVNCRAEGVYHLHRKGTEQAASQVRASCMPALLLPGMHP